MGKFRGIGRMTLLAAASGAALLAGSTAVAGASTTKTVTLTFNSGGKPLAAEGAPVSNTTFSNENTGNTGQAIGSCRNADWAIPLAKTEWISSDDACGSTDSGAYDTTDYDTQFTLPTDIIRGSIKVKMAADDYGAALLDGYNFGEGASYGAFSVYTMNTKKNPDLFEQENTLDIQDTDEGGFPYGVDYKATITYVIPKPSASVRR
jgi:hypothetical protein